MKQLQTEQWPDLSVPDNPRLLLDLVHKAKALHHGPGRCLLLRANLLLSSTFEKTQTLVNFYFEGSILVHCSAGVGRTGTLIALYKLLNDYNSPDCASLAFFPTVIALRRQRCLMVQQVLCTSSEIVCYLESFR